MVPRIILPVDLEEVFYCHSRALSADCEAMGIREDRNGKRIRRDCYNDRKLPGGWGVYVSEQYRDGQLIQVKEPMRLQELDQLNSGRVVEES